MLMLNRQRGHGLIGVVQPEKYLQYGFAGRGNAARMHICKYLETNGLSLCMFMGGEHRPWCRLLEDTSSYRNCQ